MNEVEIGGQLVPQQSFEAMAQIASNKTLFVQKLTSRPTKPEPVKGLKTVQEVFDHFKPSVKVEMEDAKGAPVNEEMNFKNLGDFRKDGLIAQSEFLKNLDGDQEALYKIAKQLKTNKILMSALKNPEAKAAFLESLKAMIAEIDNAESK